MQVRFPQWHSRLTEVSTSRSTQCTVPLCGPEKPENYKRLNDYSTDFSPREKTQEIFSHSCLNYDYGLQRRKSEELKLVERISQSDL